MDEQITQTTPAPQANQITATVTFQLSATGQKAAILAGKPAAAEQTVTGPISTSLLDRCEINADGSITADLTRPVNLRRNGDLGGMYTSYRHTFDAPPASLDEAFAIFAAGLKAHREQLFAQFVEYEADEKRKKEEREARLNATLAGLAARQAEEPGLIVASDGYENIDLSLHADHPAVVENTRRKVAAAAAAEESEAAKEAAKVAYIAEWIAANADETTREQFADGLLSRPAALEMIANAELALLGIPDAEPQSETCRDSSCPCGVKDIEALPRRIYPAWKAIKASLPKGFTVEFTRERSCLCNENGWPDDGETATPAAYIATLGVPVGPFRFDRRVKLG